MSNTKRLFKNGFEGIVAVIDRDNIDTDQIIPADFLKTTVKEGLGQHLFSSWRYLAKGEINNDFVLNQPPANNASAIITGRNFGCGSSREHAPWALADFGIRVILSTEFADIFANNARKSGILLITISDEIYQQIRHLNGSSIEVDLRNNKAKVGDVEFAFSIEPFTRYCLLEGIDDFDFIYRNLNKIEYYELQNGKQKQVRSGLTNCC